MHEFVSLSIKTAENSSWPRDIKDKVTWPKIEIIWFVTICLFTGKKKEKTMLYIFELWNQIKTIDKGYLWQKMPNISKWWWPYGITVPLLVIQIVEFQAGTTEIKFPFQNKIFLSSYLLSNSISYPNFNFKFQNFKSPAPSQVNKKVNKKVNINDQWCLKIPRGWTVT